MFLASGNLHTSVCVFECFVVKYVDNVKMETHEYLNHHSCKKDAVKLAIKRVDVVYFGHMWESI